MKKRGLLLLTLVLFSIQAYAGLFDIFKKKKAEPKKEVMKQKETMNYDQKESPMLAELVKAGKLPALEERLPVKSDIMIEPVYEELGQYGGEMRFPIRGAKDKWTMEKWTEEALFRFKVDGSGVEPNVAKGYDVNDDNTEYTIYLREGMKWSDGMPFTANDVIFYWEEMLKKKSFGKNIKNCFYSVDPVTGEKALAEITKVDDYTFKVSHKYPHVMFLERLMIDQKFLWAPAHFYKTIMSQFIGKEAALEKAKEYGHKDLKSFNKWIQYYYWIWKEVPTLRSFIPTNRIDDSRYVLKRNPYYFKTDKKGRQLPYIDKIVCDKVENNDQILLKSIAGEADIRNHEFKNFTVLKENESAGDYRVITWKRALWSSTTFQLNQAAKDEKLREVFQDIRFREALSIAANREEISEIVTSGLAAPQQASIPEGLVHYQEGWADQWVEQDIDKANKLLDEMGLKYDAKGQYRTFKDGSEFTFIIYHLSAKSDGKVEELLKSYFENVGINTIIKPIDKAYFEELLYQGKVNAIVREVDLISPSLRPDAILPLRYVEPWYGDYGIYTASKGEKGLKPEGDIAKMLEYWDQVVSAKNQEEIHAAAEEIVKLHKKNQWILGFTASNPEVVIVNNKLRNVPSGYVYTDEFRGLGHGKVQQFFFKK